MSKAGTYSNQGDDYQRAIAINWIIKMITDTTIEYIQVESNGISGINENITVDDIVVVFKNGQRKHIQAKKNQPQERVWSIMDWKSELPKILYQLEQGENIIVELYSATPLGDLTKLPKECLLYPNFNDFKTRLSKKNENAISILCREWNRSEEEIFNLLKRLKTGSQHNIEDWRELNKRSLTQILTSPSLALDTLEAFVNKHQSKELVNKFEITSKDILDEFASKGLTRLPRFNEKEILDQFQRTSAIGRNDWKRTIAGEKITRKELDDILTFIRLKKRTILVQDKPGSGKTCLLLDLADAIEKDDNLSLLFIKGDRFVKNTSGNTHLPKEIIESCGLLSLSYQIVIVIDSLDVLSCQRDHSALNYFLELIDQLHIIKNITIVAACRDFDLRYEPRLRDRKWDEIITLQNFDFQKIVIPILNKLKVNVNYINSELIDLLCLPQNLSLFEKVSGFESVFGIRTTYDLYKIFIDYTLKQDKDIDDLIFEKIYILSEKLLKEREHSLPKTAIKIDENIIHKLVSKGVLNEEADGKIGFSHQTLFDNFVASYALQKGVTLSLIILEHPQLPFYRPFVRSYLFFIRSHSSKIFSKNVREALSNDNIAYHFKRLVVETYAEMIPTNDDWNLISWLFRNQRILFKRFFDSVKTSYWFELIAFKWYPFLIQQSDNFEWYSAFIIKLEVWMNIYPNEIVKIWNSAISESWGKRNVWIICHHLTRFEHYHIDGVKDLVYSLKYHFNNTDHFIGKIYCNYIDTTGDGYDILWDWITRDISISSENILNQDCKLHCEDYELKNKEFLKKHLRISEEFLNLVMKSLQDWIENSYSWHNGGFSCKLLKYTSIPPDNIYRSDSINITNVNILMQAVEEAFFYHSQKKTKWWQNEELKFRNSKELGIRYIVIKAYSKEIESNLDGIIYQLLDKELFEINVINYELGLLLNTSFHLFPVKIQDKIIEVIDNLFFDHIKNNEKNSNWYNRIKYDLFLCIPACFRPKKVNDFVYSQNSQFGYYEPQRRIILKSGFLYSPVGADILDNLSNETLYTLFNYYKNYNEHSFHPADGNSGGLYELCKVLSKLAENNPDKYINIANNPMFDDFSDPIIKSILVGVGSHINNRLVKVNGNEFNLEIQLPDINDLVNKLLNILEMKYSLFKSDFEYARILEDCIDTVSETEDLNRIIEILLLLNAKTDTDKEEQDTFYHDDNKITTDDLLSKTLNCTKGVIATSAIKVLNNLLDIGIEPSKSIVNLVEQFANVKDIEVRAALLWDLAYTGYKNRDFGWKIFNFIFNKKETLLWVLAERFLYNQYLHNFENVGPILDRIKNEAIDKAGATWGRLSALCMIQGHINKHDFFEELKIVNNKDAWGGALSVFIANLERNPDGICQESLRKFLKVEKIQNEFVHELDGAFRLDEKGKFINDTTGKLFINTLAQNENNSQIIFFFIDWIEYQSIINPMVALELCESLLIKLQSFGSNSNLWHSKPLISALTKILREADEIDNKELINRVIRIQDHFLLLDIEGMDEYLVKATLL